MKRNLCLATSRRWIATLAILALAVPCALAAQPAGPPRSSPAATVDQTVGLSTVEISYSRPSARDREIFGELVPWGEVWRTGANEATTFTLSHNAKVQGKDLKAGVYGLFTIPTKDGWTVIFNSVADQWGAFQYDEKVDVLRVQAKPGTAPHQEVFEISVTPHSPETAEVALHWGTTRVAFEIFIDTPSVTLATARQQVSEATPEDGRMVWNWSQYFYQQRTNLDEALEWVTELANAGPIYWTLALKSRLLAATDQYQDAIATADSAAALASEDSNQGIQRDLVILKEQIDEWKAEA